MKNKHILDAIISIALISSILFVIFVIIEPYYQKVNSATVDFVTYTDSNVESQRVKKRSYIRCPEEVNKSGYRLTGWLYNNSYWDFNNDIVVENMTLYASWQKGTYTINFETNGGSNIASQEIEHGEYIELPEVPILNYNIFKGWYKDIELKERFDFNLPITDNHTIYAKWEFDVSYFHYTKLHDSITIRGLKYELEEFYLYFPSFVDELPVNKIADYSFEGTAIKKFYGTDVIQSIGEGAFYDCKKLISFQNIPSLATIGEYAFYNCELLNKVELSNTVTHIGAFSFANCQSLIQFIMPTSLVNLSESLFLNCVNLTIFNANIELKSIGKQAFKGCTNLKMLIIYEELMQIDDYAFHGCNSLIEFVITAKVEMVGKYAFSSWNENQTINIVGEPSRVLEWDKLWNSNSQAQIKFI